MNSATLPVCTDASALAEAIAQRCEQHTQCGQGWQACCPAHDDQHPSLSITAKGDKVLLKCQAGCPTKDVVAAMRLEMKDLFLKDAAPHTNGHTPKKQQGNTDDGKRASIDRVHAEALPLVGGDPVMTY